MRYLKWMFASAALIFTVRTMFPTKGAHQEILIPEIEQTGTAVRPLAVSSELRSFPQVTTGSLSTGSIGNSEKWPLRRFETLEEKVLKAPEEKEEWTRIIEDPRLIEQALTFLWDIRNADLSSENEERRLSAVRFLAQTLTVTNPQTLAHARDKVKSLMEEPDWLDADITLRKSVLSDRLELFALVEAIDPEFEKELKSSASSTKQLRFLVLAHKWAQNRFYKKESSS